jgi:hypothetical protein
MLTRKLMLTGQLVLAHTLGPSRLRRVPPSYRPGLLSLPILFFHRWDNTG